MSLIRRSEKGEPLSAADHDANLGFLWAEDDVAAVLASTDMSFSEGQVIHTRADGFIYRVAAAAAQDHHVTTAGGVKLYVLPDSAGAYNFLAFGAAGDGVTDDYPALRKALDVIPKMASLNFPGLDYAIQQTVYFKRIVSLIGSGSGMAGHTSARFLFPADTPGFKFERNNTMMGHRIRNHASVSIFEAFQYVYDVEAGKTQVTVGDYPDWIYITGTDTLYEIVDADEEDYDIIGTNGVKAIEIDRSILGARPLEGSDGSIVRGLQIVGSGTSSPDAHGIHAVCRITIENCHINHFSGHGICIWGTNDENPPGTLGNTNCMSVRHVRVTSNGRSGVYLNGADSNAGYFEQIDAVGNAAWGVEDRSFLGNTHIGHHTSVNGNSRISYGGNRYVMHPNASPEQLVETTPGTDTAVWIPQGSGSTNSEWPLWTATQEPGTYRQGGAYLFWGSSNYCVAIGLYSEGGSQSGLLARRSSIVIGGEHGAGIHVGNVLSGSDTNNTPRMISNGFEARPELNPTADGAISSSLGGNSPNGDILRSSKRNFDTGSWRLRWHGADLRSDVNNTNDSVSYRITGAATAQDFGTGEAKPHVFWSGTIALGPEGGARRQTTGTAAPTTGAWARGDIVWNNNPSAGGNAGWICVEAGTPGTWQAFGAIEA